MGTKKDAKHKKLLNLLCIVYFLATSNFFHLLITFANSLDPDQYNLPLGFENNKGTDRQFSTFVIRLLESMISKLANSEISSIFLGSFCS